MGDTLVELNDNRVNYLKKFAEEMPELFGQVRATTGDVYADGAISSKTKRLMALGIALGVGCQNCILAQTHYAVENGAAKEEFYEMIGVVTSLRGTTGMGESLKVIQLLEELGKL